MLQGWQRLKKYVWLFFKKCSHSKGIARKVSAAKVHQSAVVIGFARRTCLIIKLPYLTMWGVQRIGSCIIQFKQKILHCQLLLFDANYRNQDVQTFIDSGSQSSNVIDRTFDIWTPRLLKLKEKNWVVHRIDPCVSKSNASDTIVRNSIVIW